MSFLKLVTAEHKDKLRDLKSKKYIVLKEILAKIILAENNLNGEKMPSTRVLSESLNVSRSTVIRAYELLVFENIIEPQKSSGYIIKKTIVKKKTPLKNDAKYPSLSASAGSFMENVGLMNTTSDEEIAFRPGLPPLDIFPVDIWKRLTNQYWKNVNSAALSYTSASGLGQVKKNISYYLRATRGISVEEDQIIIVSGSLQSLFLIGSTVLDPGDDIVIENPTFPNVISLFRSLDATVFAAPLDKDGILVKKIKKSKSPKLIHVTPSNHYPTGTVMSVNRRMELLDFANRQGSLIIENEYDHEVSTSKNRLPSIFELDSQQRTVFIGTFNRILHPSIRIAYLVLPHYLVDPVKALQKHSHRSVAPSLQAVLSEFIHKDYIFRHIREVLAAAEERKKIFSDLVENKYQILKPVRSQCPSLHVLYELPNDYNDKLIVRKLKSSGILAHAYSNTFINNPQNGLIFGYSAVRKHQIEYQISNLII